MSQFIEMFGYDRYSKFELDAIAKSWSKGQSFKKDNICKDGKQKCIHYGELFTEYGPVIDEVVSSTNSLAIKKSTKGDILFPASDVTPIGLARCSTIMQDDILLGGDIIILSLNGQIPEYVSFAINMQKEQLIKRVTGSVVRHMSAKSLKSLTIPLPPVDKQKMFVDTMRQADKSKFGDFKSQFIEMFSKYPSETPWHKLLTIINGKAYPEEYNNIGTYPICGSAGIMYYGERKLCDANTIILGRKGNINHPIYMESDYWIVDTAFCLDVNKSILHPKYFYYWCCQYDFTKLNKQGVLPSLTRKDLEGIEMSVPPMAEQKKFVSIVEQADKSKSYVRIALKNLESILGYCIRQVA